MIDKPNVEIEKLKEYIMVNRSYWLHENKDGTIELHFSPQMPEALAHLPDGQPVEHIMAGFIDENKIYFTSVRTISSLGETGTERDGVDDPVMLWLQFI